MSTPQSHPGVPTWVRERHPAQAGLIVAAVSRGIRTFEEAMVSAMDGAGGPDEVSETSVDEAARQAFDGAFSKAHGINLPDADWTDLEETFCEQMRTRFEQSMTVAWHASAGPRP